MTPGGAAIGLAGRTAVVTGAGQGVGRGIALALAGDGANVVIATRRAETGDLVAAEILERGGQARCIPTDVTRRDQVEAMVAGTVEAFGGLDIMVHNPFRGRGAVGYRLKDVTAEMWDEVSRAVVWASYYCAQVAYPHLRKAGRGRLVLVSSLSAVEGNVNTPVYSPVEAALRAMAKSLAQEWGAEAITVNCIAPVAGTPAPTAASAHDPAPEDRITARAPLGRAGDPETEIGSVVAWLAGDRAGYVTGQTIVFDGGGFVGL